jgi:thiol-disulfide isomerase/thioredoxin
MKRLFAAVAVAWLAASAVSADGPKPPRDDKKPAPSLKVGDPAPALTVTKWLQGDPVRKFEPGKVYVVHFWATWCPPCIGKMPRLAELQARYKDQSVTVISFTSCDIRGVSGNTEEEVAAFVKKRGAALRLRHTLAYGDDGTTADTWLKAAGQDGWCTFVVDKAGRIAYMGDPMFLDLALPKVVAGGASAKAVGDEMAKAVAEYDTVFENLLRDFRADRDMKPGLGALMELEAKYSPLADLLPVVQAKLSLLPKYGNPGEAKKCAKAIVAKGIEREDVQLLGLAYSILRNEKESKESLALAVKAAEAVVRIDGGKDARSLLNLADAHLVSGDTAKAKEYARKAIEAAAGEPPTVREEIEKAARRLGTEE